MKCPNCNKNLSGELGVMAEVTCPKCRDIGVICKDDPAKAYVCDCQVGKQWKIEPRGAQFRRVEEQQKIIAEYRVALEAAKKHIEIAIGKDGAKVSTVWNIINKALKVTKGE